jgi:Xaa-Pro aminopeptidase
MAAMPGEGVPPRVAEVDAKLDRVRRLLGSSGYDGALFTSQPGVAWVTGGLSDLVVRNEEPALVWALITGTSSHLITNNVEAPRLLAEEDVLALGFQLQTVPWYHPGGLAAAASDLAKTDLANTDLIVTDGAGPGTPQPAALAGLRMPLTEGEIDRLAALGADCAAALETALRTWQPAERECDLAARIAAALEQRLILPSVLLAGGAARRRAFRHPVPSREVTGRDALAVVVGVRGGLNVACSRTVSAGPPADDLAGRHQAACAVEAAMIAATRPGRTWQQALDAGCAAYRDQGYPDEWQQHLQGGPIGYLSREFDVVPGSASAGSVIEAGTAFAWNPTVRGGKSEDTFLATAAGQARPVSNTADWPTLSVRSSYGPVQRPAILRA